MEVFVLLEVIRAWLLIWNVLCLNVIWLLRISVTVCIQRIMFLGDRSCCILIIAYDWVRGTLRISFIPFIATRPVLFSGM